MGNPTRPNISDKKAFKHLQANINIYLAGIELQLI